MRNPDWSAGRVVCAVISDVHTTLRSHRSLPPGEMEVCVCFSARARACDSGELLISLTYFSATIFTPAVSGLGGRRHLSDSGQLTRHRRAAAAHLVDGNLNKGWISTGLASRSDGGSVDANPPRNTKME